MGQQAGDQFSNYRLIRLVGSGGYAEVWLGKHLTDQSEAAIKILNVLLPTPEEQDKFLDEARHLKILNHPHIIKLLDFDIQGDKPFLVLEYAPNDTLRKRHPRGSILPLNLIINYVEQIVSGLQYAHDNRIIHRDIKPENMLLNSKSNVLVSDFGIALLGQTLPYPKTQDITGTISYMAPEQLDGHPAFASDQYSLAVIVYEWLCGNLPFRGTPLEIRIQQKSDLASHRKKIASISPALEPILFKALSENIGDRFRRVQEFADALKQAVNDPQASLNLPTQRHEQPQNIVPATNPTPTPNPFVANPIPVGNSIPPSNPFAANPVPATNATSISNPFATNAISTGNPTSPSHPFAANPVPAANANPTPVANSIPPSNPFAANSSPASALNPFVATPAPAINPTSVPESFAANPAPVANPIKSNPGSQAALSGLSPNNTPNIPLNTPGNSYPALSPGSFNSPPSSNPFQNPIPNNQPQAPLVLPNTNTSNSFTSGGASPFVSGGGSTFTNASTPNPHAKTVAAPQPGGNPFTSNLPPSSNGRQSTQGQSYNMAKWYTPWFNARFLQENKNQFFLYGGGTIDFIFAVAFGIAVARDLFLKENKTLELGWYIWFFCLLGALTLRVLCAAYKKRAGGLFLAVCLGIYWFLGSWILGGVIRATTIPEPVPPPIIALIVLVISLLLHINYVLKNKH